MRTTWTEEQQKVIDHRDGNLLVAAAAGSGKTAVLVEHVISLVTDPVNPVPLSSLLIMTFTEAAAEEMKERIRSRLQEKLSEDSSRAELIREAGSIQNASISTIDSFCMRLIRENYALLGLDPSFRIAEEGELELLRNDTYAALFEEQCESSDPDFLEFADAFSTGHAAGGLDELVFKLYDYAEACPWPEETLSEFESGGFEKAYEFLLQDLCRQMEEMKNLLSDAIAVCEEEDGPEAYLPAIQQDYRFASALSESADLKTFASELAGISFGRLSPTKSARKNEVKSVRDSFKDRIKELKKALVYPGAAEEKRTEEGMLRYIRVLLSLVRKFSEKYQEEKLKRRIMDFSDLEHYALQTLYVKNVDGTRQFSPAADDLAREYREILVDEYQDSNLVQESLITALSAERFGRPDVFEVGDVKQSIYRFRMARPELFLSKYTDPAYPKIELSRNFRSRPEVLDAVNAVFSRIMYKETGGIRYDHRAMLYQGRTVDPDSDGSFRTELLLLEKNDDLASSLFDGEAPDACEAETYLIADRIRKLVSRGYHYRDIVILLRSPGSWQDRMVKTLLSQGIPAYAVSRSGYFSAPEVETVLSLLSVIDNPRQSIPLAAVLHSPMYSFSDRELAEITAELGTLEETFPEDAAAAGAEVESEDTENPEQAFADSYPELADRLKRFRDSIRHFRKLSHVLPIHELLYRIYDETGYYNYVSAMPAGSGRRANLDQLLSSALSFEKTSYRGLFDFIRYIERLRKYDKDQGEASIYSEEDDLVRILSIHRSKGLQFKVVFLAGMGRRFNQQDLNAHVLVDPELGIATDFIDPDYRVRIPTLKKLAVREKLSLDGMGEEERVLYVGMTRAEDKLILTGTVSDLEKFQDSLKGECTLDDIRSAGSYLEWTASALGEGLLRSGAAVKLETRTYEDLTKSEAEEAGKADGKRHALADEASRFSEKDVLYRTLKARISWHYPWEEAVKLYPKYSVSEIKEQELLTPDFSGSTERPVSGYPGGARAGDAYHRLLWKYDYTLDLSQIPEILKPEEEALVDLKIIRSFVESPLGQAFAEGQKAGKLFREQRFMKQVPYSYLFPESGIHENVLLQGVIDAFLLTENGIVLVDYKSDRVSGPETLVQRYRRQLILYADALSGITGLPVAKKIIYSLRLGKAIEVS